MTETARRLMPLAAGVAALLLLSWPAHAISGGDPNGTPPDTPTTPYNATTKSGRVDANTPTSPFAGVGFIAGLRTNGSAAYGTATLIDSTHILTVAHAVDGVPLANLTFTLNAGAQTQYKASSVAIDPDYYQHYSNFRGDLAVVTLSTPITGVPTYAIDTNPQTAETVVTLVGYGVSGDGVNGYNPNLYPVERTTKRVGEVRLDAGLLENGQFDTASVGGQDVPVYKPGDEAFAFEFHSPNGSANPAPNYIGVGSLGNDRETNVGNGDSGAPAFVQMPDGQYEIAGVIQFQATFDNSRDTGKFGTGGGGAVLSAYSGFLDTVIAPEPGSMVTVGVGAALLFGAVRRRRQR